MGVRLLAAALLVLAACTSSNEKASGDATPQKAERSGHLLVSPAAEFSVRYPEDWAVWSYAWTAFLAPPSTPPLVDHGQGLDAESGFSMQISAWPPYKYSDYLRLLEAELDRAKLAGATVIHTRATVAGRQADRYRVSHSKGKAFEAKDSRFLRPCKACEAEYVLVRWPSPGWEIPLRFDSVARPGTSLSNFQKSVDTILESLDPLSIGSDLRGYIPMGPADAALETVTSYLEARIDGKGAERFLTESARGAYGRHLTLYWFTKNSLVPSYQVTARVPLDTTTTRFEVILQQSCAAPNECPGRSTIEFLEVRVRGELGQIVAVPECHQSSAALRACLFAKP